MKNNSLKKISFIAVNCRWTHSNLALFYLKQSIADLPVTSNILSFSINQNLWDIVKQIYLSQPDMLAFSVYIWNAEVIQKIIVECPKILPHCKIIVGGPEVSYQPEKWGAKFPQISHIICGAGEISLREVLLGKLFDTIIHPRKTPFADVPFPYMKEDWQLLANKYVYYESSRGCPFQCAYCVSSRQDNMPDYKPLTTVFKELTALIEHNPKIIKFVDRTFNSNAERARKIWQFLSKYAIKCHFEIHPQLLTEADFTVLKLIPSTRFQFEIGVQTLHKKSLQAIHRKQDWEKCKTNILRLRNETKIHLHIDLILGLPYETSETFQKAFNELYALQTDTFQLGFLKVLSGTEIQEKEDEYQLNYLAAPPYQILSTKWLHYEEVLFWQDLEKLLNHFYNSGHFIVTIDELEQSYPSPFALYSELCSFWREHEFSFEQKDWKELSQRLLGFISTKLVHKTAYFLDCLRWDWCQQANSHYYPEFLNKNSLHRLKKKWYPIVKEKFSVKQVKKAIFLEIETTLFAENYTNNCSAIVWIYSTDEKKKIWVSLK